MQLCNRIYYSKFYWRLNMFRAPHRLSSGALNCICSLWFLHPCGDWPLPILSEKRYSLELLMMSVVPLETCWAFNKLWNNNFYYKAASCLYISWVIYDARIHEYQKFKPLELLQTYNRFPFRLSTKVYLAHCHNTCPRRPKAVSSSRCLRVHHGVLKVDTLKTLMFK